MFRPWVVVAGVLGAGTVLLVLLTAFFLLGGRRAPEEEAVRPPAKTSPTSAQTVNMPAPGTKPTSPPGQRKPVTWIIGRNISSIEEALSRAWMVIRFSFLQGSTHSPPRWC
jgi:hypothetical protein